MRRLAQIVLATLLLASCDSAGSDPFSLEVTVEDTAGRPVAGQRVALVFASFGSGNAQASPAQRPAALEVSPVFPTPWDRFALSLDAPAATRVELLNLDGALVRTVLDQTLAVGVYSYVIDGEPTPGAALPAGVYQLRVTAGPSVETRATVRTDAVGNRTIGRILGISSADGTLTTTDRTAAPSLFDAAPVAAYSEGGGQTGEVTFPPSVRVVALDRDGAVVGTTATRLRDGRNRLTVEIGRNGGIPGRRVDVRGRWTHGF